MNNRISVPTIDGIQFINLQPSDVSPLMSKCDIKVLYIGQNRNNSFISRETATNMSKTLRGCPVVGWYREEQKDFGDHGDQLVIDGNGARFNVLTKPYGFVAPDAKVWFQFFEDKDEFGNTCLREYLCTEAFLWTKQFPEAQQAIDNHNPHSMELDEETLEGHWATDNNLGLEFFIINDAIFSKLCILGEEVEPCFEGSSILPPDISSSFSKDDFVKDLLNMAKELKFALSNKNNEGGLSMEDNGTPIVQEEVINDTSIAENEQTIENSFSEQGENSESIAVENQNNTAEEFAKEDEEKKDDQASDDKKEESSDDDKPASDEEEKKEEPKSKSSLEEIDIEKESLKNALEELQNKFASLEEENKKLLDFKREVEDQQKDDLIASFYMLSDEDKKDVVANKANYSLDEIEKELSVICVRKKVSFTNDSASDNTADAPLVYNLDAHQADDTPAWLKAVDNIANRND